MGIQSGKPEEREGRADHKEDVERENGCQEPDVGEVWLGAPGLELQAIWSGFGLA